VNVEVYMKISYGYKCITQKYVFICQYLRKVVQIIVTKHRCP